MKTTTMSSKCMSGARGLSHAGIKRGPGSAHIPERRQTGPARTLDSVARVTASGQHLGYVEAAPAPDAVSAVQKLPAGARHVLHLDADADSAASLVCLLTPEACVTHASTLDEARRLLSSNVFSLVIIEPALPDGDPRVLLPLLKGTPVLVHSATQPEWRDVNVTFLPKPWTSTRQLWLSISSLLGVPGTLAAGD